jgi:hypothetical protein
MPYASLIELRLAMDLGLDDGDEPSLIRALDSATEWIDSYTGRVFVLDAEDTTRYFYPDRQGTVTVPDLVELTSIATDTRGDRTYATVLADDEYELRPIDGPPYQTIVMWPVGTSHAFISTEQVKIVGTFGYTVAGVAPIAVKQACIILASRHYKRREAPFGILQSTDLGTFSRISKEDPDVVSLLAPYRLTGSSWVLV